MNPLLTLWLLVAGSAVILAIVFYLAENYSHIIGNFWVLLGIFIGIYFLNGLFTWVSKKLSKKGDSSPRH
jgi:hypothetical protein